MRRFAGIAAVLFLLLLPLAACGGAEEKAGFDPEITLQALADAGAFSEELEELDGDTAFTLYGLGNSGLEREDLTAAKVLRSAGATCEEGAVGLHQRGPSADSRPGAGRLCAEADRLQPGLPSSGAAQAGERRHPAAGEHCAAAGGR